MRQKIIIFCQWGILTAFTIGKGYTNYISVLLSNKNDLNQWIGILYQTNQDFLCCVIFCQIMAESCEQWRSMVAIHWMPILAGSCCRIWQKMSNCRKTWMYALGVGTLYFQPEDNGTFLDLNLFNASGEHWKMLRHTMSPTFSTGKIKAVSKHLLL